MRTGVAVGAALLLSAQAASAQWNVSGIGVAEYDTNETLMLLAGVSAGPGGLGLSPVIGLQAQYLTYEIGEDRSRSIVGIRPSAGLRYGYDGGAVSGRVGYAFRVSDSEDGDLDVPPITQFEDSNDGVVLSGSLDHWGSGALGFQALASYNLGAEALWSRARVTTRLMERDGGGQVRLGGEVAYMTSDNFGATQPGGVLEWHNGRGLIVGLGAGVKLIEDADDNPVYFKAEIVLPVRR